MLVDWVTSGRMARGEGWAFNRLESRNEVMVEVGCARLLFLQFLMFAHDR